VRVSQQVQEREHAVEVELGLGHFRGMFEAIIDVGIQVIDGEVVFLFGVHKRDCNG